MPFGLRKAKRVNWGIFYGEQKCSPFLLLPKVAPSYTLPRKRLMCVEFVFYLLVVLSPQSLRWLALRDSFGNINVTSSQTALTRAVLLITNKRSTLCVLSLLFVAKCSHKLGELPAGVRGMNIVVCYLFQVCFS